MAEDDNRQATSTALTRESLVHELRQLGVKPGMTLLVHSSLRSLGWVRGGPDAVVQALMDVVTETGTIVMPTQTGNYSDPAQWINPPVPQVSWQSLYEAMPAFNPLTTASYLMGKIVEAFRTWPGVLRSNHPTVSFAAWGRYAASITAEHALDYGLGEGSPLARIYDLAGWVLMLGVSYDRNTSFHLAEYRVPGAVLVKEGSPILENGQRIWKWYKDIEIDSDVFPEIGAELEQTNRVTFGMVGAAESRLFPQRAAVDFAVEWYRRRRDA